MIDLYELQALFPWLEVHVHEENYNAHRLRALITLPGKPRAPTLTPHVGVANVDMVVVWEDHGTGGHFWTTTVQGGTAAGVFNNSWKREHVCTDDRLTLIAAIITEAATFGWYAPQEVESA